MKHLSLLVAFAAITSISFGQPPSSEEEEKTKLQEIGLRASSFSSIGLTYRVGTPDALWRFQVVNGSFSLDTNNRDSITNQSTTFSAAIGLGREWRKPLAENMELRYGADLSYGLQNRVSLFENLNDDIYNQTHYTTHRVGANLMVGVNYVLEDQFVFGAELTPGLGYYRTRRSVDLGDGAATPEDTFQNTFQASFSNLLTLSVLYRF